MSQRTLLYIKIHLLSIANITGLNILPAKTLLKYPQKKYHCNLMDQVTY